MTLRVVVPELCSEVSGVIEALDAAPTTSLHPGLLHGNGFTAFVKSPDELHGAVTLHGRLEADYGALLPTPARVRGIIRRRQLITQTRPRDPDGRHRSAGTYALSDMPDGKASFDTGLVPKRPDPSSPFAGTGWMSMAPPDNGPWVSERGVLVALEPLSQGSGAE
ncbi:hypothetical protein [Rhodococcus tibetensis]|uniref:Uncharacterized protein n=1 Tax=Rhodococcus tibetensis TaxID=2965064 RepID=A0ABT1QCS4_9NOCA|nr:hypothetical protein [Rhodococcus sp. FXJ9.536]MCQ4120046.1 hypothetical protein [Rhodococcus sp. FXJ9.536]